MNFLSYTIGLGAVDYEMVDSAVRKKPNKAHGSYKVYSDKDRFSIGKNASIYGTASAVRKWKKTYPHINESTVRGFKKRYEAQIRDENRKKKSPRKVIFNKLHGRPCLLGNKIDPLVQKYLKATRYKGGVVNTMIALATAEALTKRYSLLEKDHIELGKSWAQSLFCRSGFVRRMKTTGKVCIPFGAQKEAELKFLHQIVNNVEKHQIPPNLIINFDQTPSKYVQASSTTMDKKGGSNVPIEGISDKRSITATFSVTLDNKFLPMQLIYKGKTGQSLPKVKFPIKSVDQKALLIFDVFRAQTTDKVLKVLENNNILATKIPPNMTHLFQPLYLTVNKVAKDFMRKKFSEWFSRQISIGLENGQELEDIQIDYRISVLKPMHAKWPISFYDFMSSPEVNSS